MGVVFFVFVLLFWVEDFGEFESPATATAANGDRGGVKYEFFVDGWHCEFEFVFVFVFVFVFDESF